MSLLIAIAVFVLFGSWSLFLSFKLDKANTTIKQLKENR